MQLTKDEAEKLLREAGAEEAVAGLFYVTEKHAAAFRTAIIASLCGDVEPVAWQKADRQETEDGWAIVGWLPCTKQEFNALLIPKRALCDASTVAALKARVAELEKDAAEDAELLDWIFRQGDEFSYYVIQDAPGDGEYVVHGMGCSGQGKTPRAAIRAARAAERSA